MDALRAPFEPSDLEWRAMYTRAGKDGKPPLVLVAPYVTRPALLNRLNQVCGLDGWQSEARVSGGHCYVGVAIRITRWANGKDATEGTEAEWIWRWDGTGFLVGDPSPKSSFTPSDAGKGDFSNAFKRACEQFGVAGYLRELKPMRALLDSEGRYKSKIGDANVRWNPPSIQGTPSYPGEIPGWDATEGGQLPNGNGDDDDPTEGVRQPVTKPKMSDEARKALIQDHKDKVRAFMRHNGYRPYHLDALVQTHKDLKIRYADGEVLGRLGTVEDWEIVELLTRRGQTRWDEVQKGLAKEYPASADDLTRLDGLLNTLKIDGQESIIIRTAMNDGWNDAILYWLAELAKR